MSTLGGLLVCQVVLWLLVGVGAAGFGHAIGAW